MKENLNTQIVNEEEAALDERKAYKEYIDKNNLSFGAKGKMVFSVRSTDSKIIWSEGAIIDNVGAVRYIIGRGTLKQTLERAINSGKTVLPVNADHNGSSIIDGDIGYIDLKEASVVGGSNGIEHLTAPVHLKPYTLVVKDILERQKHGEKFGLSVELDPSTIDYELVTMHNDETVLRVNHYDFIALSVVSNGAVVDANNYTFSIMEEKDIKTEIVQEIVTDKAAEVINEVGADQIAEVASDVAPTKEPEIVEKVVVEQAADPVDTKLASDALEAHNKVLEDLMLARSELAKVNAELADLKTKFSSLEESNIALGKTLETIRSIPTSHSVAKPLVSNPIQFSTEKPNYGLQNYRFK